MTWKWIALCVSDITKRGVFTIDGFLMMVRFILNLSPREAQPLLVPSHLARQPFDAMEAG